MPDLAVSLTQDLARWLLCLVCLICHRVPILPVTSLDAAIVALAMAAPRFGYVIVMLWSNRPGC